MTTKPPAAHLQPLRLRDARGPLPGLRPAAGRGPALPQRRARLLGPVAPRGRAGRLPQRRRLLELATASRSTRAPSDPTPTRSCPSSPSTRRATPACARWSARASPPPRWPRSRRASGLSPSSISDAALERGTFDFIADFAGKVPDGRDLRAGRGPAGRPGRDPAAGRPGRAPRRRASSTFPRPGWMRALTLAGYYQEMVDERRRLHPSDDLTSALTVAELDGERLTDEEIVAFLFLMVVAGNETTTKLLGNAWYWAWRHPDQRAKPFGDPARVTDWVEETLRFDTSSQMLLRVARTDLELHGARIAEGDRVLLLVGSANRDETVFPDPDRYDLDRDTSKLVSFGSGRHFCMGAPLARLEAPGGPRRAGLPGVRLRHRPRRRRARSIRSTSGAWPPSRPRWFCADGPLRAASRAPPGGGDRGLVGHRQRHRPGPGRGRPSGGPGGAPARGLRGDGRGHPGGRRRGRGHPPRPG